MDVKRRRNEIKNLIKECGIYNLNRAELGRKFNVTSTQISRDIKYIMNEIPQVNWISIFKEATQDFDRTLNIANRAMDNTSDNRLKAKLAGQISEMLLRKMSFLEKMERLLPVGAKPEPVTIYYKCIDSKVSLSEIIDNKKNEGEYDEKC